MLLGIFPRVRSVLQLRRQGGQLAHVVGDPQVLDRDVRESVGEVLPQVLLLAHASGNVLDLKCVGDLHGGVSEVQALGESPHDEDCDGEEEEGDGDVNIEGGRVRIQVGQRCVAKVNQAALLVTLGINF